MTIRPQVRALAPYHFTPRPHHIKLNQNESPYDLPAEVRDAALGRLSEVAFNRYPELHAESLREALAKQHGWSPAGVVVSNGSNVIIQALVIAAGLGQRVLCAQPTFSVYRMQAEILGAELTEIPLREGFSLPVEDLMLELSQGQGVFFLANPAAPTGNLHPEADLLTLIEAASFQWTVVLDEAYHQFSGTDFKHLVQRHANVVSLRTMSKAYGLAGVRLGYMLAQPDLAEQISKVLLPFSVSSLSTAVGLSVLEHPSFMEARVAEIRAERTRVTDVLEQLAGVTVFPSVTNFLLFRVKDAATFFEALLARDVLIRRQDHLPGLSGCLRVTIGCPAENDAFITAATEASRQLTAEVSHD